MGKKQKPKDRHLGVPAEANRDKHINFVAGERSETDPSMDSSKGPLSEDPDQKNKFKRRKSNSER